MSKPSKAILYPNSAFNLVSIQPKQLKHSNLFRNLVPREILSPHEEKKSWSHSSRKPSTRNEADKGKEKCSERAENSSSFRGKPRRPPFPEATRRETMRVARIQMFWAAMNAHRAANRLNLHLTRSLTGSGDAWFSSGIVFFRS